MRSSATWSIPESEFPEANQPGSRPGEWYEGWPVFPQSAPLEVGRSVGSFYGMARRPSYCSTTKCHEQSENHFALTSSRAESHQGRILRGCVMGDPRSSRSAITRLARTSWSTWTLLQACMVANPSDIIRHAADRVFIPITVGGGIRISTMLAIPIRVRTRSRIIRWRARN